MKKLIILTSLAILSACSVDELPHNTEVTDELKTITVPISTSSTDTRITINENTSTSDSWKFEWEDKEDVSVWYSGCTAFAKFEMDEFDADLSSFKGEILTSTEKIRVISPYDNTIAISGNSCKIDISAQDGNLSKLYMMSDELITVEGTNVTGATPEMKHLGGFFAIDFAITNKEDNIEYAVKEVKLSGVPTTMDVDMTGDFITHENSLTKEGTITATLTGDDFKFANASENIVEVRLNTLPFNFEPKDVMTFNITYLSGEIECYTEAVIENTTDNTIPLERAKFNYCTITIDPSVKVSKATINSWGQGNGDGEDLDAR